MKNIIAAIIIAIGLVVSALLIGGTNKVNAVIPLGYSKVFVPQGTSIHKLKSTISPPDEECITKLATGSELVPHLKTGGIGLVLASRSCPLGEDLVVPYYIVRFDSGEVVMVRTGEVIPID